MSEAEAETKRLQAVAFMERTGGDVDKFESMSAAEYAATKGAELLNPAQRKSIMANMTKAETDELVDTLADGIEAALDPILTREEVIEKLQELSDLANGETPDEDDED